MACKARNRSDEYRLLRELQYAFKELKHLEKENNFTPENVNRIENRIQESWQSLLKILQDKSKGKPYFNFEVLKKSELWSLKEENSRLENRIGDLEEEEKETKNKFNERIKSQETTIADLKEEVKNKKEEYENLERKLNKNLEEKESQARENALLREEKEKEKKERENLEKKLNVKIEELKTKKEECENLEEKLNKNVEEKGRLCDDLALETGERKSLEEECQKLIAETETAKANEKELERELKALQGKVQNMTHEIERQTEVIQEYTKAYTNQCTENQNLNLQIDHMRRSLEEQRRTIDKLQKNLSEEKKAKENALNRLSAAAANRLRDQNPGITDLSDPNRPLKLAEKVSELYDNEWTNAMENLESDLDIKEEKGIRILLKIIKNVFDTCADFGDNHLQSFPDMLILPPPFMKTDKERMLSVKDLPPEMLKPMKDFRKSHAKHAISRLQKFFSTDEGMSKLKIKKNIIKACEEYVNKCIELCWMMRIQDPPIYMETGYPTNSEFDSNKMRSYTKAGKFIHFVVWPTFFLHKDGPLLAKGVVQGSKTEIKDGKEISSEEECSSSNSETDGDEFDDARSRTDSHPNENLNETTLKDNVEDTSTIPQQPNQQGNTETIQKADGTSVDTTKGKPEGPKDADDKSEVTNEDMHINQSKLSGDEATDHKEEANSEDTKKENRNGRKMTAEKKDATDDEKQNDEEDLHE